MTEFCLSSTTTSTTNFSSLLFSDFISFCSFILSHPLYFSYFIFFLPYLLKLLSFLSPLFITTSLLLLALLTVSPGLVNNTSPPESSESKMGFFRTTYRTILDTLRSRLDADDDDVEFQSFEGLEAYIVVFETSTFKVEESPVEVLEFKYEENCFGLGVSEVFTYNVEENPVEVTERKYGENGLKGFLQGMGEETTAKIEENEVEAPATESNVDGEDQRKSLMGKGSKASDNKVRENPVKVTTADNGGEYMSKVMGNSEILGSYGSMRKENQVKVTIDNGNGGEYTSKANKNSEILNSNLGSYGSMRKENEVKITTDNGGEYTLRASENSETLSSNLGSFGSMRKEKEWKRTLACKLFEERQNVDEGEGMDLLWETYETDSGKAQVKKKDKKGKKGLVQYFEDEDEEEEEDVDGKLCCLQALKFSTGKMNLGMGRPNLMRISKALKGIGWFHHMSRHGKKG